MKKILWANLLFMLFISAGCISQSKHKNPQCAHCEEKSAKQTSFLPVPALVTPGEVKASNARDCARKLEEEIDLVRKSGQ